MLSKLYQTTKFQISKCHIFPEIHKRKKKRRYPKLRKIEKTGIPNQRICTRFVHNQCKNKKSANSEYPRLSTQRAGISSEYVRSQNYHGNGARATSTPITLLKGKFSSGIEGALASTLHHDFNWKQLSEMMLCIVLLMFLKFIW